MPFISIIVVLLFMLLLAGMCKRLLRSEIGEGLMELGLGLALLAFVFWF